MEIDETVKARRIIKPQHIRQLLTEQINILRRMKPSNIKEATDISRAITNASNAALTSMRDGEMVEKMEAIEKMVKELSGGNVFELASKLERVDQ